MDILTLEKELKIARQTAYAAARGGWPLPLAGATYWAGLAFLGTVLSPYHWCLAAAFLSGAIFPLALLYGRLLGNRFLKVRVPDQGLIYSALVGMLLFWPSAVFAMWHSVELVPLIIGIGMSVHWPMIGWAYARPVPFFGHVIMRTVAIVGLWQWDPAERFVMIPAAIAVIYGLTVVWLQLDSGQVKRALEKNPSHAR